MDSQQLRHCIAEDSLATYYAGGVLASNDLPSEPLRNRIFIINTEPTYEPGQHWLIVYLPPDNHPLEYFDSLGQTPSHFVRQFLNNQDHDSMGYVCHPVPLQSKNASTCGHFCLYYMMHRVRGLSMSDIIQEFIPMNYISNEEKVMYFVKKHFNTVV